MDDLDAKTIHHDDSLQSANLQSPRRPSHGTLMSEAKGSMDLRAGRKLTNRLYPSYSV